MVLTQVIHTVAYTLVRFTTNPILSITFRSFPYREAPIFFVALGRTASLWVLWVLWVFPLRSGASCLRLPKLSKLLNFPKVRALGISASLWVLWVIPLRYGVYFTQPTQSLRSKRLYPISPEHAPLAALPIAPTTDFPLLFVYCVNFFYLCKNLTANGRIKEHHRQWSS